MIPLKDCNSSKKFPIINILFILINIACFIYELFLEKKVNNLIFIYGLIPFKITHFLQLHLTIIDFFLPFVSSIFLHAGWMHLIGNMLYLWIFGDNIEGKLGHLKYFVFYLTCGVIANFVHIFLFPNSKIPCIGASGAIAGVLGAYLVTFPKAKILTLVPIWFFLKIMEIPAFIVLGLWFIFQWLNGVAVITQSNVTSGIGWWVHISGFISGIFLVKWLK